MSNNDWRAELTREAARFANVREAGNNAAAIFATLHAYPVIKNGMDMGTLVFAPESDENAKTISQYLRDMTGCAEKIKPASGASLTQSQMDENAKRGRVAALIQSAMPFLRAICILSARTSVAWKLNKRGEPMFPVAWFAPEGMVENAAVPAFYTLEGKRDRAVSWINPHAEAGTDEAQPKDAKLTVSAAKIVSLVFAKKREASEHADASNVSTLSGAVEAAASMLAKADNVIAGEASDAFFAMVGAFMDASPANLAQIAGMVEVRIGKHDAESAAA